MFRREILGSRPWLGQAVARAGRGSGRPWLGQAVARAGRGSGRPSAGWSRCATARRWLVWPTKDVAFTARERLRWEALFADHRAVLLEGAGHHIQDDAPEQIVGAIRDWAAGAGTGLGG